jgi:hypothetical protein
MDGNIDKIDANLKLSNEMSHVVVGVPVLPKDYLDGERCPSGAPVVVGVVRRNGFVHLLSFARLMAAAAAADGPAATTR